MERNTYTVYTEDNAYFDVRDIEDLVRMRDNKSDFSPTRQVFDDNTGGLVDRAEALCYDKKELG